jgi:hypothetical protein
LASGASSFASFGLESPEALSTKISSYSPAGRCSWMLSISRGRSRSEFQVTTAIEKGLMIDS